MSSHAEMVSNLILQLELDPNHYDLRLQAQRILLELGPEIIPQLVQSLNHPNLWIVSSIIEIIGEYAQQNDNTLPIPKLQLLDLLIPFLSTKELVILRKTINALVKIGDPKQLACQGVRRGWIKFIF